MCLIAEPASARQPKVHPQAAIQPTPLPETFVPPSLPEPWLRGPLPGIPATLQPAGHALVAALEETQRVSSDLATAQLWLRPGGIASIGFHLLHLAGSTDRLLTYARGEALSESQRASLADEQSMGEPFPSLEVLLAAWNRIVEQALVQLAETPDAMLDVPRTIGRAELPSTVRGLLFHAAEHAQRHAGQVVTTARLIRSPNATSGTH